MRRGLIVVLSVLAALTGCRDSTDLDDVRLQPKLPPPPSVTVPAALRIEVEIAGQATEPIEAATLNAREPDFRDGSHRAWRILGLAGAAADREGAVISVEGEEGLTITMKRPQSPGDLEPALILTRRGEIVAALISPADPFPPYHGQGRRLSRGGDRLPRLGGVKKILISFPDASDSESAAEGTGHGLPARGSDPGR
jgi:hypothetical protein